MNRRIATFFAVVVTLWGLLHVYMGRSLSQHVIDTGLWATVSYWSAMALLAFLPVAAMFAGRTHRVPSRAALEWAGFTAMGLSTMLFLFVLGADIVRVRLWIDPWWVSAGVVALAVAATVAGAWRAGRPGVVRVEVPIGGLPDALHGFRIVQLSDLHIGPTLKRRFVERVVSIANGLDPHLIALTGDVADGYAPMLEEEVAPLARLLAAHGKFFVTGNHEYYWDAPGWVRQVEQLGFSPLINQYHVVERGTARLLVAGVTDGMAGAGIPGHRSDPVAAVQGAPAADVRLLLAHQPTSAFAAQSLGFDLQLSGHTHGGQYFPFNLVVRLFQPFVAGLHRLEKMWLYVSRGTGYWGPPMRLGAPSEITLIELVPA